MKTIMLMIFIGFITFVSGDESINDQIEKIQNAPAQERVELMNRLKLQIAAMNETERSEALNALQHKGSNNKMQIHRNGVNEGSGGQYRYRMNTPVNSKNQQGHQGHP